LKLTRLFLLLLVEKTMATNRNELEARLDRVNNWVNNCDQKSSILLAIEGVVLTILCTSDYISFIRQQLIFPIYNYYETGNGMFSIINTIQLFILAVMFILIFLSVFYSLQVIKGTIDTKLFKQSELTEKSLLHFSSISNKSFNEFKKDIVNQSEETVLNDLLSQIYINSSICDNKFKYHKKSVRCFCLFLFLLVLISFIQLLTL